MTQRLAQLLLVATQLAAAALAGAVPVASANAEGETVVPSWMCGPYFIIPIEVDGKRQGTRLTLDALFDTGGNQLAIDTRAVERLFGRPVEAGEPVKLTNATAGPVDFRTLKPRALSLNHISRALGVEIDLFLPLRAFRSSPLTLDFPARQIRVGERRLRRPDGVEVFDARGPDQRPYLGLDVGGRKRRVLIDSGSSGSIAIHDAPPLRWLAQPRVLRVTQGMERIRTSQVGRLASDTAIAGVSIPTPIVTLTDQTELIGTQLMKRYSWTFDQKSRRVRIRPASTDPLLLDSLIGTGAISIPTDSGLEIARVIAETPAAEAGLSVGDLIVAVDGSPVYEQGCERWDEANRTRAKTLTINRGNESFEATVSTVALLP